MKMKIMTACANAGSGQTTWNTQVGTKSSGVLTTLQAMNTVHMCMYSTRKLAGRDYSATMAGTLYAQ